MKRKHFIATALALIPISLFPKMTTMAKSTSIKGFKVNSGEARNGMHYKMKGVTLNKLDCKISSFDTDGALTVFEQNGFTPKGGPPLHIHLYQDEYFYIVEGEYIFQVGGEKYQMRSGDTIFLPREVQHAFVQLTETGRVIVSYMPAGRMEDFFKTTDLWTVPPSNTEIERVFEDHDMKVVGPPLKVD
jgi:quercetin dioxygenase-like cupin family protein